MNTEDSLNHIKRYKLALSAVHLVYRLVNSTSNVDELCLRLTRLLCQFIKAHSARVYLLDSSKMKIDRVAIFNNKINILLEKRKELTDLPEKELQVAFKGMSRIEKKMIGLPLIAEDNVGAIFIYRSRRDPAFTDFERELLGVFAEQSVTAIKNLQLYQEQQNVIIESIRFIGQLMQKNTNLVSSHDPVYFKIMQALAEKLRVSEENIRKLQYASVLHNIGSMDVPYELLAKKEDLTSEEFKVIQTMPKRSAELIKPIEFLKPILPIILYHREWYDGTGYPSGLSREQIPIGARIVAVVEAFEAMVQGRPYKQKLTIAKALDEIREHSGSQFDPRVVEAFCTLAKQKKFRNYLRLL